MPDFLHERHLSLQHAPITVRHIEAADGRGLSLELPTGGGALDAHHVPFFLTDLREGRDGQYTAGPGELQTAVVLYGDHLTAWCQGVASAPLSLTPADRLLLVEATLAVLMAEPDDLTALELPQSMEHDPDLAWTLLREWHAADQAFQAAEQEVRSNLDRYTSPTWQQAHARRSAAEDAIRAVFAQVRDTADVNGKQAC